jgi:hypothetical protein
MRRILSFIVVSFTGLVRPLPRGPDDPLYRFSLDPDPSFAIADTDFNLLSQTGDPTDKFSSPEPAEGKFYDLSSPIPDLAGAPSGPQCLGEATESIHIARSLELDQPYDVAGEGVCLQDSQPKQAPIKLDMPNPTDLFNLLKPDPERDTPPKNSWPGIWYCAAGDRVQLVCCEGRMQWDSSREGCSACKYLPHAFSSHILVDKIRTNTDGHMKQTNR